MQHYNLTYLYSIDDYALVYVTTYCINLLSLQLAKPPA